LDPAEGRHVRKGSLSKESALFLLYSTQLPTAGKKYLIRAGSILQEHPSLYALLRSRNNNGQQQLSRIHHPLVLRDRYIERSLKQDPQMMAPLIFHD